MRIAIFALGSRGDVQPYIALGKGLQAAGHTVRLISHENYEQLVNAHGLEFWPMPGDVQEFTQSPEMQALLEKGNFIAIMKYAAQKSRSAMLTWAREGLQACQGVDCLLAGFGGLFLGLALAEKLDISLIQAHYVPFTPTREFAGALVPPAVSRLGKPANLLSHHLTRQLMWQQGRSADAAARQQILEVPAAPFFGPFRSPRLQNGPILYGFSETVVPKPGDWDGQAHVTGYWFLESEQDWRPPPALEAFLERGPAPISIGFGSMSSRKPEEIAQLILQAVAKSGQRAILLAGWKGLHVDTLPEHVFVLDSAPHEWLFSRVSAVVHHGGAGTTAAGLRAGVPSVVIPFFADQPFWGQRVVDLGVGPAPIPRKNLTVDRLAQAIQQAVQDVAMRQRAADMGVKIRAEDGVRRAVEIIEKSGM
jgi:sterol 3beta-glucosyltransferase